MNKHNTRRGFTLIELLVVVLIIGILAAVALPQYQKAVMKAKIASYMPVVDALYQAEQLYYLREGEYTDNLRDLDIEPPTGGCSYITTDSTGKYYACNNHILMGIFNGARNAQAQDYTQWAYIRWLQDYTSSASGIEYKKGDIVCFSKGTVARQACQALGAGEEYPNVGWDYAYILK